MSLRYSSMPLGELCDVTIGRQRSPKDHVGTHMVRYLRAANVKDGRLDLSSVMEMNFDPVEQVSYGLRSGDVLVTEGCGSAAELGASARWQGDILELVCFQNTLLRLRARPGESDPGYLYHVARWCHSSGAWLTASSGTSILHIGHKRAKKVPVPAPPLAIQRKIAAILSAYDDLIENNNRRIKLLEEMAQRIYREWFVDFRYPGHEEGRGVASALGDIPEGWNIRSTAALITAGSLEIGDGYRAKKSEFGIVGLPFVRIRNMGEDFDFSDVDVLPFDALPKFRSKVSQPGDSVVSTKGTVGRVIHVTDLTPRFVYSPQLSYWRLLDDTIALPYLRAWLDGPDFERQCAHVKGSTDMADYVNLKDQRRMLMVLPPQRLQRRFEAMVGPMHSLADHLRSTRRNLRATRDLLLPRLISGEIDVTDLDVALPKAAA